MGMNELNLISITNVPRKQCPNVMLQILQIQILFTQTLFTVVSRDNKFNFVLKVHLYGMGDVWSNVTNVFGLTLPWTVYVDVGRGRCRPPSN